MRGTVKKIINPVILIAALALTGCGISGSEAILAAGAVGGAAAGAGGSGSGSGGIAVFPPEQAVLIGPTDGAVNVPLDQVLSWYAAKRANGYDVFFGTSSPPPLAVADTKQTTYDAGTLSYYTTYYWRINSKNAGGTTRGAEWSFRAIIEAPDNIATVTPNDGTVNVAIDSVLSWSASTRAGGYYVYFGTASQPPYVADVTAPATQYNPGAMQYLTSYYWKIIAHNPGGNAGEISGRFQTIIEKPADITGITPVGGISDVSIDALLDWNNSARAAGYYVHFGISPTPPYKSDGADSVYDPGGLAYWTSYNWKITAHNQGGNSTVASGSFMTTELLWQKMFGGSDDDKPFSVRQTSDGGYIIAGFSNSTDIPGCTNLGEYDCYVIKLDNDGNITWHNMYGGSDRDWAYTARETSDGGYIVAGYSRSTDIPGCTNQGKDDCYIIKLDNDGNVDWQKLIGGDGYDRAWPIDQTLDNGYIFAGFSNSTNIPGCTPAGSFDFYVAKLFDNGTVNWQNMYGGSLWEQPLAIEQTADNGYVVAGFSESTDLPGCANQGYDDCYIVKLDNDGTAIWQKTYGGNNIDWAISIRQTLDGGYIVGGGSDSTNVPGCLNGGLEDFYIIKLDNNGDSVWQKMFGGDYYDYAYSIQQTLDGGYVAAGYSSSTNIPGCTNDGYYAYYIVKLNANGNTTWQKMFGGSYPDMGTSIHQTEDGGFVVAGHSDSTDIPGCTNQGGMDFYIIRIHGNITWQRTFGGNFDDWAQSVRQTSDGGYIVAGYSQSTDIPGCTNQGSRDFYVTKLDYVGNLAWHKMLGGSDTDWGQTALETADGGYIIAGDSRSTDIPTCTNQGWSDCYLVKLDNGGATAWQKTFGGNFNDYITSIRQTSDNGYIVAGYSYSTNIPGCTNNGLLDYYVAKLDNNGNATWQKMYGGSNDDWASAIRETADGGYVIAGYSSSSDIAGCTNLGGQDYYIIKLDNNGNVIWREMFGGNNYDRAFSVLQAADGGYVVAGFSNSTNIPGHTNQGYDDFYFTKLDNAGNIIWQKTFGGSAADFAWSIHQAPDGGYVVGGHSSSTDIPGCTNNGWDDFCIIRLDGSGNMVWLNQLGGNDEDYAYSLHPTSDGGYVLAGRSISTNIPGYPNQGGNDYYIMKLDQNGNGP